MSEEMKRMGAVFKAKREELKLTLKEVENSTSIRAPYLEAIEEGAITQFISGIYALGFVKQYGHFLGFDMETMIREHPIAFKMPQEQYEFSYGIGTLEKRGTVSGGVKWLPNLLWIAAFGLILFLAWYLAQRLGVI